MTIFMRCRTVGEQSCYGAPDRIIEVASPSDRQMDYDLKITDMAGASPARSSVIVNFASAIRRQLANSTCYVYSDNVQYRFKTENGKIKS